MHAVFLTLLFTTVFYPHFGRCLMGNAYLSLVLGISAGPPTTGIRLLYPFSITLVNTCNDDGTIKTLVYIHVCNT